MTISSFWIITGLIFIVLLIVGAVFLTKWLVQQSRAMQQASDFQPEGSPPQADVLHPANEHVETDQ